MGRVAGSGNEREPYWRTVLDRWKRSGLSGQASCLAEGVSVPSFYWWRRQLQRRDQPKPTFLPVHGPADKAESPAEGYWWPGS